MKIVKISNDLHKRAKQLALDENIKLYDALNKVLLWGFISFDLEKLKLQKTLEKEKKDE